MALVSTTLFDFDDDDAEMGDEYAVIAKDDGKEGKFRLVDIKNDSLHYGDKSKVFPLEEIVRWVDSKGYEGLGRFVEVLRVIRAGKDLDAFVAAYMPRKRIRIPTDVRKKLYVDFDGRCAYCGCPIDYAEMQVDHIESHYRHGGADAIENFLPSCADCNGLKSDYTLDEFRLALIPNCAKKGRRLGKDRSSRICKKYGLFANPRKKIVFYFEKREKE